MMHDREKSDPAIVAEKPTNKAGQPAAESAEPRGGPRGTRAGKARTGRRDGSACHRRWNAYDKSQGKGRRRSAPTPRRRRLTRDGVLRAQTRCGPRR